MSARIALGLVAALILAQPVLAQPAKLDGSAAFTQLDTNGDGLVTKDEVSASRLAVFERLDTNGDSVVDQAELATIKDTIAAVAALAEAFSARQFHRLDTNHDQLVSRDEATAPGRGFDWVDRNHDGALDKQEFEAVVAFARGLD